MQGPEAAENGCWPSEESFDTHGLFGLNIYDANVRGRAALSRDGLHAKLSGP